MLALSKWFPSSKHYGKIWKYEHFGQQHVCLPRTAEEGWVPVQSCCLAQAAPTLLWQGTLLWKHNSSSGDGHFRAVFLNCLKLKEHQTLLKKTYRSPWKVSPQLSPSAIQGQNFVCSLLAFAPFSSRLAFCTCESTWVHLVTPVSQITSQCHMAHQWLQDHEKIKVGCSIEKMMYVHIYNEILGITDLILHLFAVCT